ncbi:hypothetical protein QJS04_geneDACA008068 [Acorus gramineus]|uniref:Phospholipase/carboxylesterase/thioesterase domain-containing protein n=1 Tax=Acorus gramineus TaxID=55184 RepID=A0AAV9BC33_ACOGR|nr:hypothetical protein QJS04_geneDACA008068 [Acorus gramineus]
MAPNPPRGFIIWLHGMGGSGPANEYVKTLFESPELKESKWAFPSAPRRPISFKGVNRFFHGYQGGIPAWFDIYAIPMTADSPRDEKGLLETVETIHALIDNEVAAGTDPENIFVCGFSQGAAMAFATALLYPKTLGGGAVFAGWVPFSSPSIIDRITPEAKKTPILWFHGEADRMAVFGAGQAAPPFLEKIGMTCEFKAYPNVGHTITPEQYQYLESWIQKCLQSSSSS